MNEQKLMLTPEIASNWITLIHPTNQRKKKNAVVKRYAKDMETGNWFDTGEPVRFDTEGYMIDGQHRCFAVLMSGCAIPIRSIHGVDKRAVSKIDRGAARSMRDVVTIELGSSDYAKAGEVSAFYLRHVKKGRDVTDTEIVQRANKDSYKWIVRKFSKGIKGITISPVRLAAAEFWDLDKEKANEFCDFLLSGAGMDENHPVLRLRNYLLMNPNASSDKTGVYRKAISACVALYEGRPLSKIYGMDWPNHLAKIIYSNPKGK